MKDYTLAQIQETYLTKIAPRTRQDGSCLIFTGDTGGTFAAKLGVAYGKVYNARTRKTDLAHRLAYAYYTNTTDLQGLFVLHSCDNPSCVAKEHLRLGTHVENMQDMRERNRRHSKLTPEQVELIYYSKESTTELMQQYNVTRPTINEIRSKTGWKFITEALGDCGVASGKERTREAQALLSVDQVKAIYKAEDTLANLALKYKVDITTISKIKCGINWKEITQDLGDAGVSKHPFKAKLTKETVAIIYKSKENLNVVAKLFGVSSRTVTAIRAKETWVQFTNSLDKLNEQPC